MIIACFIINTRNRTPGHSYTETAVTPALNFNSIAQANDYASALEYNLNK